jgi:aminopeptidase N
LNEEGDGDMYSKGSLFLNTLRHIVNDDKLWWSTIKSMCDTTFKMKNIGYEEVVEYFNGKANRNLSAVFEQYLKHSRIPVFEYKLEKVSDGIYNLTYRWDTDVKNFEMPAVINLSEEKDKRITCTDTFRTVRVQLPSEDDFEVNKEVMYIEVRKII